MNKKLSACLFVIVTLSYCFIPAVGAATVLDFEGITPVLPNPGYGTVVVIPDGYGGLNWSGTTSPPIASEGHSAFSDGAVSPIYAAVFGTQTVTVTNPNGTFDFLSVWITGGWANKTATVFGYLNDVEIYSKTDMVATDGVQTQYTLNWTGIDKLVFPIVEDGNNDDYVLDNFTIDNVTVPEPSTFALGVISLLGLSFCTRSRRNRRGKKVGSSLSPLLLRIPKARRPHRALIAVAFAILIVSATTDASATLIGDSVNGCLNGTCSNAIVVDPGVEFSKVFAATSGTLFSADLDGSSLTITAANFNSSGLISFPSGNQIVLTDLDWVGVPGVITGLVIDPAGNLPVASTVFGADSITVTLGAFSIYGSNGSPDPPFIGLRSVQIDLLTEHVPEPSSLLLGALGSLILLGRKKVLSQLQQL